MRHPASLLALALLLAPIPGLAETKGASPAAEKPVQWVGLEEGLRKAGTSGKHVFVSVYTDWCGYCRKLNTVTFRARPVVAELEKNFQSVRINAEGAGTVEWKGRKMSERELAGKAWGVSGYPTLLFISPKGEVIGSFSSYADPDLMVQLLHYISSGARERKVSFDDFLEGKG